MKAPNVAQPERDRIDWSQLWYPGPTRVFTAEELQQAGDLRPSATLSAVSLMNFALIAFMVLQFAPARAIPILILSLAGMGWLGAYIALRLWRKPSRCGLAIWSMTGMALLLAQTLTLALSQRADRVIEQWVLGLGSGAMAVLVSVWWFITVYRAHQIEARLRELSEQARALDMARQLAAAQIQPHFLFNSLASLQHWVQTKDDRAAPMLEALMGFLRATLPLFNQQRLALGAEADAVQQYLAVMHLRLGERLRYRLDLAPQAVPAQMPPGLLLTLVENAIEHGVMPSLTGAEILVQARVLEGRVQLRVQDNGAGLGASQVDGVGLTNVRTRLGQSFGGQASLSLQPGPDGGCRADLEFPLMS